VILADLADGGGTTHSGGLILSPLQILQSSGPVTQTAHLSAHGGQSVTPFS